MTTPAPLITIVDAVILPVSGERGDGSNSDTTDWFRGWLSVGADGRISAMGEGEASDPTGEVIDASGAFLAPGFISAHSHLFTSGMRGMTPGDTLYPWVAVQTDFIAGADEEDVYWFTLHGCLDFIANGVTSAYNFADSRLVGRYDAATDSRTLIADRAPRYLERQIDAARDAGLRTMTAIRLDSELQPAEQAFAHFAAAVEYLETAVDDELRLGASVFGAVQWADTPQHAIDEVAAMDRHGIGNQAHMLETAEALEQQREKFGWYEAAGALRPGFLFGHFVHPDADMVARAAASGAGMVWQPASNGRLGSGVADIPAYLAAGMPVGVGLDDQSCTDVADPFQNMRIGMYTLRATRRDASAMMPRDMLRLHTLGSAEALGVADRIGSLEVGKFADFLLVDPTAPDTGPVWDPYAHYVMACGQRNVKAVYSGGVPVVVDGVSTHPDAQRSVTELHARIRLVAERVGLALAW